MELKPSQLTLKPLGRKDFYRHINKKRFSVLSPWFASVDILDAFRGEHNGIEVCIFQIGRADGTRGGAYQTAVHIRSDSLDFPKFILKPTGIADRIAELFGARGINFSNNNSFSDKYVLKGGSEGRVRALFNQNVIQVFERHEGFTVEANGNEFLIFKERDLARDDEHYIEYIERAVSMVNLFEPGS